jgi:hypothetical protein
MSVRARLGSFASAAVMLAGIAVLPQCSVQNALNAVEPCDEAKLTGDAAAASVKAALDSINALSTAINSINKQFTDACNAMDTDLGLPTGTDAATACKPIHDRVNGLGASSVIVTFAGGCEVNTDIEASCQASCTGSASCDVTAHCDPGKLYGSCSATCMGKCDVEAPSVTCSGTCYGECDLSAAASCSGECNGSCSGNCNGYCDGKSSTGSCAGTCVGSCDAQCKGSCSVSAGASCSGQCKGRCEYDPGSATCTGECHGGCSVAYTAPKCEAALNCTSDVNCQASCHAQAAAQVTCQDPSVQVQITGDAALAATVVKHGAAFGAAALALAQLVDPATQVAKTVIPAIQNVASYTGAEIACAASALQIASQVDVSVQVSVSASATFQAGS